MDAVRNPVSYARYRSIARSGDILLCRPVTAEGRSITGITGARFSHTSMAGWVNEHRREELSASALMLAESLQHRGKRLIPLSGEIQTYSGIYDVYRVNATSYDGEAAFAFMARACNSKYGWFDLSRTLCRRHLCWPFTRIAPVPNSDDPRALRDCSAQIHAALRVNMGLSLFPADCDCEPGDLPRLSSYLCTLYATEDEAADAARSLMAKGIVPNNWVEE